MVSDTASLALLPALVRREELIEANSAAMLSQTLASTVGPSVVGILARVVSAPFAIAVDAASYVGSAVASYLIIVFVGQVMTASACACTAYRGGSR